jgi:hypothetical protein
MTINLSCARLRHEALLYVEMHALNDDYNGCTDTQSKLNKIGLHVNVRSITCRHVYIAIVFSSPPNKSNKILLACMFTQDPLHDHNKLRTYRNKLHMIFANTTMGEVHGNQLFPHKASGAMPPPPHVPRRHQSTAQMQSTMLQHGPVKGKLRTG